jgi:hypothetical protein
MAHGTHGAHNVHNVNSKHKGMDGVQDGVMAAPGDKLWTSRLPFFDPLRHFFVSSHSSNGATACTLATFHEHLHHTDLLSHRLVQDG